MCWIGSLFSPLLWAWCLLALEVSPVTLCILLIKNSSTSHDPHSHLLGPKHCHMVYHNSLLTAAHASASALEMCSQHCTQHIALFEGCQMALLSMQNSSFISASSFHELTWPHRICSLWRDLLTFSPLAAMAFSLILSILGKHTPPPHTCSPHTPWNALLQDGCMAPSFTFIGSFLKSFFLCNLIWPPYLKSQHPPPDLSYTLVS